MNIGEKSPCASSRGKEKKNHHFEICQSILLVLTRPALRRNYFTLGKGNTQLQLTLFFRVGEINAQLQPSLAILSHLKGENWEALVKFIVHRLTKKLRPNHRTVEHFPSLQHLTTTLLKACLPQFFLPSASCPAFDKKLQGILKGKIHRRDWRSIRTRVWYGRNVGFIRPRIFKNHG